MVQFPSYGSVHLWIQCTVTRHDPGRVTPFGHRRITGYVLLPVAFRSLSRPSSPCGPKASTMNPYSLDHMFRYPLPDPKTQVRAPNHTILSFALFARCYIASLPATCSRTSQVLPDSSIANNVKEHYSKVYKREEQTSSICHRFSGITTGAHTGLQCARRRILATFLVERR